MFGLAPTSALRTGRGQARAKTVQVNYQRKYAYDYGETCHEI
jgi:hypothetical protein